MKVKNHNYSLGLRRSRQSQFLGNVKYTLPSDYNMDKFNINQILQIRRSIVENKNLDIIKMQPFIEHLDKIINLKSKI